MGKLIFILGGAQSGKSGFAVSLAKSRKQDVLFVATCLPYDLEMKEKIRKHRLERPKNWVTLEAGLTPFSIKFQSMKQKVVLVDSLTLWAARCLEKKWNLKELENKARSFTENLKKRADVAIVVSDEVGLSIVPGDANTRKFRVFLGRLNQIFAKSADSFAMVFAGIPVYMKGNLGETEELNERISVGAKNNKVH